MSLPFMLHLLARDLEAAVARARRARAGDLPDTLDNFLQFRIADLSVDPEGQPWLGRAVLRNLTARAGSSARAGSTLRPAPTAGRGRLSRRARYRRQGVAIEVVHSLFDWALANRVDRFRASVSPATSPSLAISEASASRQVGVQIDDIDGEELVFELDDWPPARRPSSRASASRLP